MESQSKSNQSEHPLNKNVHPHVSKVSLFILLILGLAGLFLTIFSLQQQQDPRSRASEGGKSLEAKGRFVRDEKKGMIWDGLREPPTDNSPCRSKDKDKSKDLLERFDPKTGKVIGCTHGPDPAPEGVDVRNRTEPLQTGEEDATAQAPGGGGSSGSGPATVPASPTTCDGDGVSGNRVQVLYARASDKPDRYAQYLASIQAWSASVNNIFVESGLQTGSARNVRFVHDANCFVKVDNVVLSPTGDDNWSTTVMDLQSLSYDRGDRKYLIFMDANIICGEANLRIDSQPGANNMNNYGAMWARVDNGCWNPTIYESPGYAYAAHELMHTMGGVQSDAPHRSYQSHCTDEYDLMCYNDDANVPLTYPRLIMTYPCPSSQLNLFDCNDDDYYHTGIPPVGSYLETHWNTANNIFLFAGSGVSPTPTPPPGITPPVGDTEKPVITISSPANGSTIGNSVSIQATATDNVAIQSMELWIDSQKKRPSVSGGVLTYTWNSRKASRGLHTITVKALDTSNNPNQISVSVTK